MTGAELIRETRRARRVSQAELARRLGISQPSVARMEGAGDSLAVATLRRALGALGASLVLETSPQASGIDESLLREALRLTPGERIERFEHEYVEAREFALAARAQLGRVA